MKKKFVAGYENKGRIRERTSYKVRHSFLVSTVVCLPLIALPAFLNVLFENQTTFAQPENQTPESIVRPPGSFGETSTPADNATRINHPDSEFPVLEKESDKGLYTVQLRFTTFSLLPRYGFDMEILFLDPQNPQGTRETVTQTQTNFTAQSSITSEYIDPSIILHLRPVESYDMTVYSDTGEILWEEKNRPVAGGRAFERVVIEDNYSGQVTIEIDNIRPGIGTLPAEAIDSVSYVTKIESS